MKKIEELKGTSATGIEGLGLVVEGLFELDMLLSILADGGAEVTGVNMTIEKIILGGICRMLGVNSNAPTEETPYWFIILEARCGAVITLKSFTNEWEGQ